MLKLLLLTALVSVVVAIGAMNPAGKPETATAEVWSCSPLTDSPVIQWTTGTGANNHFYQRICTATSWPAAQAAAAAQGKYLVTITTADEQDFVFHGGLVNVPTEDSFCDACWYWAGGMQANGQSSTSAGWSWVTPEAWSFTAWPSGEPNDQDTIENGQEQHLELSGYSAEWNDQNGDEIQASDNIEVDPYIVEWEDVDADGVPDLIDNCVGVANPNQEDSDEDRIGNACDELLEGPPGDPTCSDGLDNDADHLIDEEDPDCQTPPTRELESSRPSIGGAIAAILRPRATPTRQAAGAGTGTLGAPRTGDAGLPSGDNGSTYVALTLVAGFAVGYGTLILRTRRR